MNRGKHFQSNRRTRIYLDAIAEVIGPHGLRALLRLAGLELWLDKLPPYDGDMDVDFADVATLNATLESMYGPRGGRALALRAGRASFQAALEQLGERLGVAGAAFQALPTEARVRALLEAVVRGNRELAASDVQVHAEGDAWLYVLDPCPACWGRAHLDHTMCHSTVGFLREALFWADLSDDYGVEELDCAGKKSEGDARCVFRIARFDEGG